MRFTLNSEDLSRMQRFAMQRVLSSMPNRRLLFGIRVLSWFAIAFAFFRLVRVHECCESTQPILQQAGYSALAAVVLFTASNYIVRSAFSRGSVSKDGWFTSEQSVSVEEEHITHITSLGEAKIAWSKFVGRAEDERNFYLFIDRSIGFVFPKSAIPDPNAQARIRTKVQE